MAHDRDQGVPARWQAIDLNGDGEISQIEFIKALRRDHKIGTWVLCAAERMHKGLDSALPLLSWPPPAGVCPWPGPL